VYNFIIFCEKSGTPIFKNVSYFVASVEYNFEYTFGETVIQELGWNITFCRCLEIFKEDALFLEDPEIHFQDVDCLCPKSYKYQIYLWLNMVVIFAIPLVVLNTDLKLLD
jgi:hypothetical protein